MDRHIKAPFDREEVKTLKAGDYVYIDGIVYSARDAAHKRMYDAIMESGCVDASGTELYEKGIVPIDLNGNVIYYLGPTPAKPGQVIGSAGPTTSSRMDKYTPLILSKGLCGMIGKGKRSQEVIRGNNSQQGCVSGSRWRCRSASLQMYQEIRGDRVR